MIKSEVFNIDCLEFMRSLPDKAFSLAVVDPPYSIGSSQIDKRKQTYKGAGKLRGRILIQQCDKFKKWDIAPAKEYFDELFRVSENQIIWGGNYFSLPPTRCICVWDKVQPWENFSQVEIAWTSFDYPAKLFQFDNRSWKRWHPTGKPVELYAWILKNFAKEGDTILDTHLGGGTSRIAAYKMGFDFVGCEIDKDYFDKSREMFEQECLDITHTKSGKRVIQTNLFDESEG